MASLTKNPQLPAKIFFRVQTTRRLAKSFGGFEPLSSAIGRGAMALVILAHVTWPRAQPLGQSVSLKFSFETRLESESFEPLIDFLAFLV